MRRQEDYIGWNATGIEVQGKRRGRPKRRWAEGTKADLGEKGMSEVGQMSSHIDLFHLLDIKV